MTSSGGTELALGQIPDLVALEKLIEEVEREVTNAMGKFAPFNSAHEGWAVIREEVDELWEEVKANRGYTDEARIEAIQIAAMAVRYVLDVTGAKRGL